VEKLRIHHVQTVLANVGEGLLHACISIMLYKGGFGAVKTKELDTQMRNKY
jgi:hypothetical protein